MRQPTVVICGSRRFHSEIRDAAQKLRDRGYIVFEPILNRDTGIDDLPPNFKRFASLGLVHHHLDAIRKASICLIFNKGGYMGNSTSVELGFAVACGLVVYALELDREDRYRDVLFNFVVGNVDEFIRQTGFQKE